MREKIHVLSRAVILDQGHLLLCKTLDLPVPFYFLPGGHVEHGESAAATVVRELQEEAGAVCQVRRFLGCLEYSFVPGHNSICHDHEYNLVFELTSDQLKVGREIPRMEDHIELLWVPLGEVSQIDLRAEPFKQLVPEWLLRHNEASFKSEMI